MAQYFISKDCLGKYFSFYLATNEPERLQYVHVTSTFWPFEKNYNWHKVKKKNPEKYSATNNSQKQMELSLELHNQVEPFFLDYRSCFIASLAYVVPYLHILILWCKHRGDIRVSENDFSVVIHLTRPAYGRSVDDGLLASLSTWGIFFFVKVSKPDMAFVYSLLTLWGYKRYKENGTPFFQKSNCISSPF